MTVCALPTADRRRTFWTTQPTACAPTKGACGDCGGPGLELLTRCESPAGPCGDTPYQNAPCDALSLCETPRTLATNDWVRGLALNMLLTDAREPDVCEGWAPGSRGGHWSESFMTKGRPVGTRLRQIPTAASVTDLINLIRSTALDTLNKLVDYGVASSVSVVVKYLGGQVFSIEADIYSKEGTKARVGVSASSANDTLRWVAT